MTWRKKYKLMGLFPQVIDRIKKNTTILFIQRSPLFFKKILRLLSVV